MRTSEKLDAVWFVGIWLAVVALANPLGEFALNDDWCYARAVRDLLATGAFRPCGWGAMTLVVHTLWGALFCLPFGYSLTALRISTIVMGALGLAGIFGIGRALGLPRRMRWMVASLAGFNPLYFVLACSYMTDVTGTVLAGMSAWFLVRHLLDGGDDPRRSRYLAGVLFAVAAVLTRQIFLAVPLAFACASLATARRRGGWPGKLAVSLLPALVCGLAYAGFSLWARPPRGRAGWVAFGMFAGATLAFLTWMAVCIDRAVMPWSENVIKRYGFGPILLGGDPVFQDSWKYWFPKPVPQGFWWAVTIVGIAGTIPLLWRIVTRLWTCARRLAGGRALEGEQGAVLFLVLTVPVYMLPLMVSYPFDRHLIFCAFLLGLALLLDERVRRELPGRVAVWGCVSLLALQALATVTGTHDYLAINRAKWRAADRLMAAGVPAGRIDAGFEFNGYYRHTPETRGMGNCPNRPFSTGREDHVVCNVVFPGYTILAAEPIPAWLPGNRVKMLVLKRATAGRRTGPLLENAP